MVNKYNLINTESLTFGKSVAEHIVFEHFLNVKIPIIFKVTVFGSIHAKVRTVLNNVK